MEFSGNTFKVWREESSNTLYFQGRLRLNGRDQYQPLSNLIEDTVRANPGVMVWDVMALEFINGSGLDVLYRAVLALRARPGGLDFLVRGSDGVAWQQAALPNIKKLMPDARLVFENPPPATP